MAVLPVMLPAVCVCGYGFVCVYNPVFCFSLANLPIPALPLLSLRLLATHCSAATHYSAAAEAEVEVSLSN